MSGMERYLALVTPTKTAKKPRARPVQKERFLQTVIVQAIERAFPRIFVAHVPSGGSRNAIEAVNLKRAGVKRGVPDLILILPDGRHGWMEVKAGKITASSLSDEQKGFRDMCEARGILWAVVNDVEDALDTIAHGWLDTARARA